MQLICLAAISISDMDKKLELRLGSSQGQSTKVAEEQSSIDHYDYALLPERGGGMAQALRPDEWRYAGLQTLIWLPTQELAISAAPAPA